MIADAALLGADSLVVGFAVAPALRGLAGRLGFALACGLADGVASAFASGLAGVVSWSPLERLAILPAVFFSAYGVAVFALADRLATPSTSAGRSLTVPVYVLAPALAVDNLLYVSDEAGAVGLGVASAVLALLGLALGASISSRLSVAQQRRWLGVGLVVSAVALVVA
jgi:hypothetical protein